MEEKTKARLMEAIEDVVTEKFGFTVLEFDQRIVNLIWDVYSLRSETSEEIMVEFPKPTDYLFKGLTVLRK